MTPRNKGSDQLSSSTSLKIQKPSQTPKAGATDQKVGKTFLKKSTPAHYPGIKPKIKQDGGLVQKTPAQLSYANSSGNLSKTISKTKNLAGGSLNSSLTKPKDPLNVSQTKRKSVVNQSLGKMKNL